MCSKALWPRARFSLQMFVTNLVKIGVDLAPFAVIRLHCRIVFVTWDDVKKNLLADQVLHKCHVLSLKGDIGRHSLCCFLRMTKKGTKLLPHVSDIFGKTDTM